MEPAARVMFVCVGNSCRSQMAQGFFEHHARARGLPFRAASAGTRPAGYVHPSAIAVMAERGIDIAAQRSKGLDPEAWQRCNAVIALDRAAREARPADFGGLHEDWSIEDPFEKPLEAYRVARDRIEAKVLELLKRLTR